MLYDLAAKEPVSLACGLLVIQLCIVVVKMVWSFMMVSFKHGIPALGSYIYDGGVT